MSDFRWPLDPALASTPDDNRIARALYATPLQTDEAGEVIPGLCSGWDSSSGYRVWRFNCRDAPQIAAELRRVARLRASPANWIFASVDRISVPAPGIIRVALPFAWRRFPYALTTTAAAPRLVPGPFRLLHGSRSRVDVRRGGTTVVFRRLGRLALMRGIRNGELDEVELPTGDVGLFRGSRQLHSRPLLAVDVMEFGNDAVPTQFRRAYWATANRGDYQALVEENGATAAYGIVGAPKAVDPSAFRRALGDIRDLPPRRVRISVPPDPTLQYGARLLYAQWREVGLGAQLVPDGAAADASVFRDAAVYPQREALLGPIGVSAAIGADDQRAAFDRVDVQLERVARVIPICWVADARWVSSQVRGWRSDVLGNVDYTRVSVVR